MSEVHSFRALDSLSGSTRGSGRGRALPLDLLGMFYFIRLGGACAGTVSVDLESSPARLGAAGAGVTQGLVRTGACPCSASASPDRSVLARFGVAGVPLGVVLLLRWGRWRDGVAWRVLGRRPGCY